MVSLFLLLFYFWKISLGRLEVALSALTNRSIFALSFKIALECGFGLLHILGSESSFQSFSEIRDTKALHSPGQ